MEKAAANPGFLTEEEKELIKRLVEKDSSFEELYKDINAPLEQILEVLVRIDENIV